MIPKQTKEFQADFKIVEQPSKTYCINLEEQNIQGYCNGLEAVKQAVYKALNTQRYDCMIYSWNYGSELTELFGKPMTYVQSEIKRRITEALTHDNRIEEVLNFIFKRQKNQLHVTFTVISKEGSFESEVNMIV